MNLGASFDGGVAKCFWHFKRTSRNPGSRVAVILLLAFIPVAANAQQRIKSLPGYQRYQQMSREVTNAVKLGALSVTWTNDGKAFEYRKDGRHFRYDIATKTSTSLPPASTNASPPTPQEGRKRGEGRRDERSRPERPERGRQYTSATSPDGRHKAFYRDHNQIGRAHV